MARKPRTEMVAETRAKLISSARRAFGTIGYAAASMDDFTAEAGLTRGALYHHFGDKKGLLEAVIRQIDAEMGARLHALSRGATDPWQAFADECVGYIEMALEPEVQRIMLRDGPAVLGDPSTWPGQSACIRSLADTLSSLEAAALIAPVDAEATARILNGAMLAASLWIANAEDAEATAKRAVAAFQFLLSSLRWHARAGEGTARG
jgi:AcrR family transcriptional regulator